MGTSIITYRDKTIETEDAIMEVWLKILVDEIDKLQQKHEWLVDARTEWEIVAVNEFGFGVIPELDQYIKDESQMKIVLGLARCARARLLTLGHPISPETLNSLGAGQSTSRFTRALPLQAFLQVADAFIGLLQ
jgi:hypothetical protein